MTDEEKLATLRKMLDEGDTVSDDTANTYLAAAEKAVINLVYPFGDVSEKTMPEKYEYEQIEIAAYMLNKRGAEGQVTHTENGVQRQYENADVPPSMLKAITPYCGVIS